ncbi:MAG TPA: hypothetical protein VMS79_05395 [Methanomassiliicoccales archaeon]|nr:hypothetical protein [Methanomassiliicoccales archaeon]
MRGPKTKEEEEELHLEMHRAADELGKFAARMTIRDDAGISPDRAKKFMQSLLVSVTKECFAVGADLIGHVKAFMHSPDGSLMSSLVDLDTGVQLTSGLSEKSFQQAEVILHVIVHGIWDDKVRDATRIAIKKVIDDYGLKLEVLQDYYETEKSIAHHLK